MSSGWSQSGLACSIADAELKRLAAGCVHGGGRKDQGIGGASEGFLSLSPGRDGETMKGVMENGYGSRFLEL